MRVQIITKDNGWGLSRDVALLRSALVGVSGHNVEVVFTDWQTKPTGGKPTFDLNIFLELLSPGLFGQARKNVFVPNPEWYFPNMWASHLRRIDQVWCKTQDCLAIFSKVHRDAVFSGWTSHDLMDATVDRERAYIHVAGGSSAKGTKEVLQAFSMRPSLDLTLISSRGWGPLPSNVKQHHRLEAPEFIQTFNQHLVHLCPSSYEGFGHYINEARSVGAMIISTNAAPMNELAQPAYSLLASVLSTSHQNIATHQHVDPFAIAELLDVCERTPVPKLKAMGEKARAAFLSDSQAFDLRLIELLR
jgi:hypothetical protein